MTPPAPRENPRLIGQAHAEARMRDPPRGGRLHYDRMLTGADEIGKATLACRFARTSPAGGGADAAPLDPSHPRTRSPLPPCESHPA